MFAHRHGHWKRGVHKNVSKPILTKLSHMFGSKPDLKMLVDVWGFPPLKHGTQKLLILG